jgi:hypothetical protein
VLLASEPRRLVQVSMVDMLGSLGADRMALPCSFRLKLYQFEQISWVKNPTSRKCRCSLPSVSFLLYWPLTGDDEGLTCVPALVLAGIHDRSTRDTAAV